jgi:hypothetical protein
MAQIRTYITRLYNNDDDHSPPSPLGDTDPIPPQPQLVLTLGDTDTTSQPQLVLTLGDTDTTSQPQLGDTDPIPPQPQLVLTLGDTDPIQPQLVLNRTTEFNGDADWQII